MIGIQRLNVESSYKTLIRVGQISNQCNIVF